MPSGTAGGDRRCGAGGSSRGACATRRTTARQLIGIQRVAVFHTIARRSMKGTPRAADKSSVSRWRKRSGTPRSGWSVTRMITGALGVGFACLCYSYLTLPDVRPLAATNPGSTAFMDIRADQAHDLGKPARHAQRWVGYNRISPNLKRAVLVAEDAAFWDHEGVDSAELQKSIELDWARGQLVRGASTITQQLAKNLYLSPARSPMRKLRELVIARRLEAELKKSRILE